MALGRHFQVLRLASPTVMPAGAALYETPFGELQEQVEIAVGLDELGPVPYSFPWIMPACNFSSETEGQRFREEVAKTEQPSGELSIVRAIHAGYPAPQML